MRRLCPLSINGALHGLNGQGGLHEDKCMNPQGGPSDTCDAISATCRSHGTYRTCRTYPGHLAEEFSAPQALREEPTPRRVCITSSMVPGSQASAKHGVRNLMQRFDGELRRENQ